MVSLLDCITSSWKMKRIPIDNVIFRLHYRGTFFLLLFFSILIFVFHFFKNTIVCLRADETVLDQCFFQGIHKKNPDSGDKTYYTYSPWVFYILFFQAFPFYFPRFLWKCKEKGKQESMLLQQNYVKTPSSRNKAQTGLLIKLMGNRIGSFLYKFIHGCGWYAYWFFGCEVLNFVVVILEFFLTNHFLKGQFLDYGPRVLNYVFSDNTTETENPIFQVFPIITRCEYKRIGASGIPQLFDTICSLPINPYQAWIYVVLWFWFIILATLSGLVLLYRIYLICPRFRFWIILWINPKVDPSKLETILNAGNIGDWLLLNRLCKNMDQIQFRNLIDLLYGQIQDLCTEDETHKSDPNAPNAVNYVFVNSHVNQMMSTVALTRALSSSDSELHKREKTLAQED